MSSFGDRVLAGGRKCFWAPLPFALPSLWLFVVMARDSVGVPRYITIALCIALCCLMLWLFDVRRFSWAGRVLTGMIFLAYVGYVAEVWIEHHDSFWSFGRRSQRGGLSAIVGLLIIGLPALKYAITGRFSEPEGEGDTGHSDASDIDEEPPNSSM